MAQYKIYNNNEKPKPIHGVNLNYYGMDTISHTQLSEIRSKAERMTISKDGVCKKFGWRLDDLTHEHTFKIV